MTSKKTEKAKAAPAKAPAKARTPLNGEAAIVGANGRAQRLRLRQEGEPEILVDKDGGKWVIIAKTVDGKLLLKPDR